MVDKLQTAKEIWEELRKNPGGFEKLAMERSMDSGSRSLGGLLAEPISRHAYPAERLRRRLPPARRRRPQGQGPDPQAQGRRLHRPDPGRRGHLGHPPARRGHPRPARSTRTTEVKKQTFDMIYEVKLKEAMGESWST